MRRICIQWPRFGPYHLARLRAAHQFFGQQGVELVGLETAGSDETYAWRTEDEATPFRREQVFPGATFEKLRPAQIHEAVLSVLDRLDPDAVAINSYAAPDARACLYWCRSRRRTAVLMTDSKEDDAPRTWMRERLKSLLVGQFDGALLAGTVHREYIRKLGLPGSSILLGYDVVDNDYFRAGADEARRAPSAYRNLPGLDETTPFFLASNRFVQRKNLHTLVKAYQIYRAGCEEPWRLVLLGDGPERPRLEAFVASTKLPGVTFAGFRQIDELPAYYGLASAFVHPALADQWGLVVNEAMAAGLPVLVSERAGCAQDLVFPGENGFRFNPTDAPALADLMENTAADASRLKAMGECSRQIISKWSPELFAQNLWAAAQVAAARARRRFDPAARLLLLGLQYGTRDGTAFYAVKE